MKRSALPLAASVRVAVLSVGACLGCGGSVQFEERITVLGSAPASPAPEAPRVELREDRIVINEKIQFAYNDDRILSASFSLLDEVAGVLKQNPQVKKVEVGGHASTEGSDEHNMALSDRRARAVMNFLVERAGVAADRLMSKGYGETKPLVSPDDTEQQREINRRVEFLIVEQDVATRQGDADPVTGVDTVGETKTETSAQQAE